MSKRDDIKLIKEVKEISYSEARKLYHENGDDLIKALDLDITLKALTDSIPMLAEAIRDTITTMCEAIRDIDWAKAIEAVSNIEEVKNVSED